MRFTDANLGTLMQAHGENTVVGNLARELYATRAAGVAWACAITEADKEGTEYDAARRAFLAVVEEMNLKIPGILASAPRGPVLV
jgi:hypothetical protein